MKRRFLLFFMAVLMSSMSLLAQKTVSGTITDSDGLALIGVNILESGTSNGTITDIDGKFSLNVSGNDAVLIISYTGFATQQVTVGDQTTLNLEMSDDAKVLDEVIVTALGFEVKRDETGTTASNVRAEDMVRSGESTLLNSLGAKASNVLITRTNGDPGAGSNIRIRGDNSITGSSNPLIILDGIPVSNNTQYGGGNNATGGQTGGTSQQSRLNDLNPADIESVTILKGASAAALWGSRASNGVLVITTKNGKTGRPKISYKSSLSFDKVNQRYDLQDTWGQGRNGSYSPTGAEAWGDFIPDRSRGADVFDTASGEKFVAADGTEYYPIEEKNSKETFVDSNWDGAFQTGGFFQNDLSISGGNEKANYYFSLGHLDQEGIIRESFYDRTNLRFNTKFFFTDWLSMSSRASYTKSKSNRIQQSSNTAGLRFCGLRLISTKVTISALIMTTMVT